MAAPRDMAVEDLPAEALRRLVGEWLGEVARPRAENAAPRAENAAPRAENAAPRAENAAPRGEIARLKGLSGRPKLKPSGMERATAPGGEGPQGRTKGAARATELVGHEEHGLAVAAPPGSRFTRATRMSSSGSCGRRRG